MSRKNNTRSTARTAFVLTSLSVALLGAGYSTVALALPTNPTVVGGNATFSNPNASQLLINQMTGKAIINWDSFNIGASEKVQFAQLSNLSVVLNRVKDTGTATSIMGQLSANGRVFLVNPNGIVFGAGSKIDVAGLMATTLDVDNDAFMADGSLLTFTGVNNLAKIVNDGEIKVGDNGFVYLVAPSVENNGTIGANSMMANVAQVTLAAGNQFSVNLQGGNLISFSVSADALTAAGTDANEIGVKNGATGFISAQNVLLSANQTNALMSSVVNNAGVIAATTLDMKGANIVQAGNVTATDTASLTATQSIVTADNSSTRAHVLNLAVTADGASVGAQEDALRVDADILNASATNGHVIVTDVSGGVALGTITTGNNDDTNQRRAIIGSEGGDITSADPSKTNITAWSTTLTSSGAIGSDSQALNTDVSILNATAANGGINVHNVGGLMLGTIQSSQLISSGGQTVSSSALSDANGNIRLSNGTAGTTNVSIEAGGDLVIGGAITAGNALNLTSDTGSIYIAPSTGAVSLTGKTINLAAGKAIGADGSAVQLQSEILNATANDGGIFVSENNGLTVGTLSAGGAGSDVSISVNQGDLTLGSITAGGMVSLTTTSGAVADNNGGALNVSAAGLDINASGAIGSNTDSIDTDVDTLDVTTTGTLTGTYLSNDKVLAGLSATTNNGDVNIGFGSGALAFNHSNSQLTVTGSNPMDLAFSNQAGDIVIASNLDVGNQNAVSLTSTGDITATGATSITAQNVTLDAGGDIGGGGASKLHTNTTQLDATSAAGAIYVNDTSTGALTVTAFADGKKGAVSVTHSGDMTVDSVSATGNASLDATGKLLAGDAGGGANVTAGSAELTGSVVGGDAAAFVTQVSEQLDGSGNTVAGSGQVSITSGGNINYSNTGSLSLVDATAQGDINFNNQGDAALGKLQAGAGKSIVFKDNGAVTDGNGSGVNVVAKTLIATAGSFGTPSDAIETQIGNLTIGTTSGGINLANVGGQALALVSADTGGVGSVSISSDGDVALGLVDAGGSDVTLTSGGAIEDARTDKSVSNVTARNLTITADGGIGKNGTLGLNVSQLSASGGSGGVQAANVGAIAVDASTLEGKGGGGVSITATDITILDDNGGTITMDPGGDLILTATSGSIVFLNQADTIHVQGDGNIVLTALGKSDLDGYNGAIIVGNLKTDGGSIKLEAQSNITIGLLDATTNGDVSVIAHNGVLLDGNGSLENIVGNHVVIETHTPSQRDAQTTEETAIAEYAAKQAELNDKEFQLEVLIQQLQSYQSLVDDANARQLLAAMEEKMTAALVAAKSSQVDSAQAVLDGLDTALSAATIVRNAAAIIAGAAQAVPFSGDAGADAAFAAVDLVLSIAQTAVDTYERFSFNPLAGELDDLNNQLDQAEAALNTANTSLRTLTAQRDTWQISKNMADEAVFKATVAANAAEQLRTQAISATDLNKDIDSSADKPLGISANKLDITGSGADGALNTSLYLDASGNLGLGNIKVASGETINAQAGNNIGIVGNVVSDTSINLNAGGAILGQGGVLITPTLTAVAQNGIGMNQAVNTQVSTLAAAGGAGGVNISNRTGQLITISELGAVKGITGAGNITLDTDGDMKVDQLIQDTTGTHTVTLNSGGEIIDGNDTGLNAQGGELVINAAKAVNLDTEFAGLTANLTGTGNLDIRNMGDLAAHVVTVADGNIDINTAGNLVAGSISADASTGAIALTASGRIDGDGNAATSISGDHLTLTAGGSIGETGDRLTTQVNTLDGSAGGAIQIAEADDLTVGTLKTTQGDVFLTTLAGSLTLGNISTATDGSSGNTITVVASGSIDNGLTDDSSNLTAANLSLSAGSGMGAGKGLNVDAARLEASGGTGGIALTDLSGDLLIDTVATSGGAPALNGLNVTGGDIDVNVKGGALTVEKTVANSGSGNVKLGASGAIVLDAGVTGTAAIAVNGGGNVTQNANIATTAGNVTVGSTTGNIVMADGTSTTVSDTGDVSYTAGGNANLQTINGTNITVGAGGSATLDGNLTGTAAIGVTAATDVTQNANIQTQNGNVTVVATAGDLTMADGTSTTVSGTGDVSYTAGGDANLQAINGTNITVGAGGSATLDGQLTGTAAIGVTAATDVTQNANIQTQNGNITVTATNGNVRMDDGTSAKVTSTGDVSYTAGGDMRLEVINGTNVTLTADGAITLDGNVTGVSAIKATAGGDINQNANVLSTNGPVTVASTAGDITMADGTSTTVSGNGDVSYTASAGDMRLETINGRAITLGASGDITLDGVVTGKTLVKVTADGNVNQNANIVNANGPVTVVATNGNITMANPTSTKVTGTGDVSYTAGGDMRLEVINGTNVTLDADGVITLDGNITGVSAIKATAGSDINQNANVLSTNGPVTVASTAGDITMATGTSTIVTGNGDVSYTASAGDMLLETITGRAVTLGASGNITLDGVVTGTGAIKATAGNDVNQNANIATASGPVTVVASNGNITMADPTSTKVTGTGDVSYTAGGDMRLEVITGSNVTLDAANDITLDGVVTGAGAIKATAGNDVNQNANIVTGSGPVTVVATNGDITMADGTSTTVTGNGDVSYDAKGNIQVNTISAQAGNVAMTADTGSIEGNASAVYHVASKDLTATAATGIGSLQQVFKTRVDTLTAQVSQGGTINIADADAVRLTKVTNANGLAQVTAGGDITADDVQSTSGTVSLTSTAGSVNTSTNGLIQASDLQVTAQNGVSIQTRADHASVAVLGQGDLNIDETAGIALDQLSTANGNITVAAAGGINVQSVSAAAGNGDVSLTAGDAITRAVSGTDPEVVANNLNLTAGTGIGNGDLGALELDINHLHASSAAGDVNLNQDKAITVDNLVASQGNMNLQVRQGDVTLGAIEASGQATVNAAAGALRDDGDDSTRVVADSATLTASGDIGVQTRVNGLSATAGGAVDIDEADGLASLTVQSPAGDVSVRSATGDIVVDSIDAAGHTVSLQAADGTIGDAGVGVASVTADLLVLDAAHGVGSADNAMDVLVHNLSAQGGTGGIYVNNLFGGQLALSDSGNGNSLSAGGDIVVTTAGDLQVDGTVANTGNGRIVLQSGGDIVQDGDIAAAGNGDVSLISSGSIDMGDQAKTTGNGDILYQADNSVSINQIETSTGADGGRVTLTAPTIIDNMPNGANIKAAVIDMDSRAASPELVKDLVGDSSNAASVNLDSRPYAGAFTQSQQFINQLPRSTSVPFYGNFTGNFPMYGAWMRPAGSLVTDSRNGGSTGSSASGE